MSGEREIASAIIRSVGGGLEAAGALSGDPVAGGITKGAGALLSLVAQLVEKLGREKAEEVLRELAANPAQPITDEQLGADVERIKREFGGGS